MTQALHRTRDGGYSCAICNEPVKLETAVADENGRAVHKDCYEKLRAETAVTPGREAQDV